MLPLYVVRAMRHDDIKAIAEENGLTLGQANQVLKMEERMRFFGGEDYESSPYFKR